jgi:hypothetical protein
MSDFAKNQNKYPILALKPKDWVVVLGWTADPISRSFRFNAVAGPASLSVLRQ